MLASGALGPQVGELLEGDAAFAQAVLRKLQLAVEFDVLVRDRARQDWVVEQGWVVEIADFTPRYLRLQSGDGQ